MTARDDAFQAMHGAAGTPRRVAEQLLAAFRAEVLREAAEAVEGLDEYRPGEHRVKPQAWLDGCSDGLSEAAALLRRMAQPDTTQEQP